MRLFDQRILETLRAELTRINALAAVIETELLMDGCGKGLEIPFIGMRLRAGVLDD